MRFKRHHQESERQPKEWEKTSANHRCDKGLISKTLKVLLKLDDLKKKRNLIFLNGQSIRRDIFPKKIYREMHEKTGMFTET